MEACVYIYKSTTMVIGWLFSFIYRRYLLPIWATPWKTLVVSGDSARIQDETTDNSAWFFDVLGVKHHLGLTSHPKD